MRAGKMDRTIVIRRWEENPEPNEYGTAAPDWVHLATLRAQAIDASTEEFIRAYGASDETAVIFRTRWLAGVTTQCCVHYQNANYDIKEVKEIGRRRGLELRAVATSEAA